MELFGANKADTPPARRSITKSRMGKKLATNEYLYEALATDLKHKQIFPLRTKIMARTFEEFGGWVRHDGEEFIFVLSGTVKIFTEFYTEEILRAWRFDLFRQPNGPCLRERRGRDRRDPLDLHADLARRVS